MVATDSLLTVFLAMPGGMEWIMILLAVVLLFGGKKIPELMKGLGKGVKEFKDAKDNVTKEFEEGMREKEKDEEITRLKQQLQ